MKDKDGKVIYVGKAKSLKNRVRSYFDRTGDLTLAKKHMVDKICDIETILCATEVEALVLETNLIKHLTPKYNILMKDDKNLAYIKITNSSIPELVKTRQKTKDGWEYYGPYVSAVEQCVRALRRIFRIRNCRMKFSERLGNLTITDKAGKTVPCMDYYIWLCPAPCLLESEKVDEHATHIDRARRFLRGDQSEIFGELEEKMREYARSLDFEKAQEYKAIIDGLRWLGERQQVRDIVEWNIDICIKYEKYDKVYIWLTQVRSSQIVWVFRHEIQNANSEDVIVQFLSRQYLDPDASMTDAHPDLLLLSEEITDAWFLDLLDREKIALEYPKIGPKNDLLTFTLTQTREYAYKREMATLENKTLSREHMKEVLETIGYPVPESGEIVFECYDISHTDGHFTYASRVSLVDGKPDPKRYKKYKIKTLEDGEIDDFASHREVMVRRTVEWLLEGNLPHLIIIDGGKGQLSSALSWVAEGKWKSEHEHDKKIEENFFIPICSIAKREEEIFLPGKKPPVIFEHGKPPLMVLQKARDEAHRFSITANKSARMKSMKKNILEEIPGIGPVTRKKLLKLAWSIDEIKNIELAEIEKIATKSQIDSLRDHGIY